MAYLVFFLLIWGETLKEIGEFLKESRVENGVSIEEASDDLNVTSSEIENLEEGNIKAFKDVYYLKNLVKEYSKYLGQDPDHILDEFNDFMFEHTSKISLDDIKEAKKKIHKEEKPVITSPYTQIKKKKLYIKPIYIKRFFIGLGIIVCIMCAYFIIRKVTTPTNKVSTELKGVMNYEYTY